MQALDLNLAHNPFRNNTLLWAGYGGATALLLAFSIWNGTTYTEHRARLRELRDTAGSFESQRLDLETRGKRALDGIRRFDVKALELQAAKANEIIEWKAFSWTRLFNTLERVQPNRIRMSSVRPIFSVTRSAAERERAEETGLPVALEGVASDLAAFTALERAMQDDPSFRRVEPDRLARTDGGEIVFQMHAWYRSSEEEALDAQAAEDTVARQGQSADEPAGAEDPRATDGRVAPDEAGPIEAEEPWDEAQVPGDGEVQSAAPGGGR